MIFGDREAVKRSDEAFIGALKAGIAAEQYQKGKIGSENPYPDQERGRVWEEGFRAGWRVAAAFQLRLALVALGKDC